MMMANSLNLSIFQSVPTSSKRCQFFHPMATGWNRPVVGWHIASARRLRTRRVASAPRKVGRQDIFEVVFSPTQRYGQVYSGTLNLTFILKMVIPVWSCCSGNSIISIHFLLQVRRAACIESVSVSHRARSNKYDWRLLSSRKKRLFRNVQDAWV